MDIKKRLNNEKAVFRKEYLEFICLSGFIFLITFVFLLKSPLHIWNRADAGIDSSVFQTIALMMDNGYVPYRDTFDHKGPLIYLINWIGRRISTYGGVWFLEVPTIFFTFIAIYKIARLKCGKIWSCGILLVTIALLSDFFDGGNLVEEYAMPLIGISLFIFLDYLLNQKVNTRRLIFCGFAMGGTCLLRINMISVWLVFCVAILGKSILDKNYKELRRFIIFFLIGFLIIIIPVMVWHLNNHAFQDFWYDYITFNQAYVSAGMRERCISSFFAFFKRPIILLAIIISVFMFMIRDRFLYGIYTCYLFATLLLISISGMEYPHYGMVLVPAVAFPIASLLEICIKKVLGKIASLLKIYIKKPLGKIVVFIIATCFLITILPKGVTIFEAGIIRYMNRDVQRESDTVKTICSYIEKYTSPEEKISVFGNWNIIYVRSERIPATKYSYQSPIGMIAPYILEEYWRELEEEPPEIIVVSPEMWNVCDFFLNNNKYNLLWAENEDNPSTGAAVYINNSNSCCIR